MMGKTLFLCLALKWLMMLVSERKASINLNMKIHSHKANSQTPVVHGAYLQTFFTAFSLSHIHEFGQFLKEKLVVRLKKKLKKCSLGKTCGFEAWYSGFLQVSLMKIIYLNCRSIGNTALVRCFVCIVICISQIYYAWLNIWWNFLQCIPCIGSAWTCVLLPLTIEMIRFLLFGCLTFLQFPMF